MRFLKKIKGKLFIELSYFDFNSVQDYIHTLCRKMMSFSESLSPVTGSTISFLINFSTHSWVTTAPLNTIQR